MAWTLSTFALALAACGGPPATATTVTAAPGPAPSASADPSAPDMPPRDAIMQAVRPSYGRVQDCYDAGLARNPRLTGHVTMLLEVMQDGRVARADGSQSDLEDKSVVACIERVISAAALPPFRKDYVVGVPFTLVPSNTLHKPR